MPDPTLESLRPTLLALPTEDVSTPDLPIAVVLQEANDLLALVRQPHVQTQLTSVGMKADAVERLQTLIAATRAAQSEWAVLRDNSKSEPQRQREAAAEQLRLDLLAAARWNLRADRVSLGTLSAISEGEGIPDLIQDLNDLAELIQRKQAAFDGDTTFDAGGAIERARSLASELAAATSSERLGTTQASAKDLRDRAYSMLDDVVAEIREAGRYGFRRDEAMRRSFASRYLRRKRRQTAGSPTEAEVPVLPPSSTT